MAMLEESIEINNVLAAWRPYVATLQDWQAKVQELGLVPKVTGCGPVYEFGSPLAERAPEAFAIADMRNIVVAEPHYHPNGETEMYIVLSGSGLVVIGGREMDVQAGSVVVMPPNTAHFTIPKHDLVIAVINTPSSNPANYVTITETNLELGFNKQQFDRLTAKPSAPSIAVQPTAAPDAKPTLALSVDEAQSLLTINGLPGSKAPKDSKTTFRIMVAITVLLIILVAYGTLGHKTKNASGSSNSATGSNLKLPTAGNNPLTNGGSVSQQAQYCSNLINATTGC